MSEVKWIKIKVDIFNDEKIQLIETMPDADTIIVIWFKLLSLAGIKNDGGIVRMNDKMAYTEEMLSIIFRRKKSVVILALETFRQFDMIDIVDNAILINNWEKHQNVDGLDKIKLQNKERQQRYRENQKTLLLETKELDNKELDKKNKRKSVTNTLRNVTNGFNIPTINEIEEYCKERNNNVNANTFYDFYESKGWVVGKNKMKNWKAAVRTWESNRNETKQTRKIEPSQATKERYGEA
jgi:predicted phage replisome organizer